MTTHKNFCFTIIIVFYFFSFLFFNTNADEKSAAIGFLDAVLAECDKALTNINAYVAIGEKIAERHIKGGAIGTYWGNQSLGPELYGRSGGMVNIGFDRIWKKERTPEEEALDTALFGFDRPLTSTDKHYFDKDKARGCMIVGFGPALHPQIKSYAEKCDVFFDTGFGNDDRVVALNGMRAGQMNHIANALHGWMVIAETVGALTRKGKMPCMWKSYGWPDGKEWGNKYLYKMQFDDEHPVPPQPAGSLAEKYVKQIRSMVEKLKQNEIEDIQKAGRMVGDEIKAGRKIAVAWEGHMPEGYVALRDDAKWCVSHQLHVWLADQRENFRKHVAPGTLVLRLGTYGIDPEGPPLIREKTDRWILITGEHIKPEYKGEAAGAPVYIALGFEFGDACVQIDKFPIPVFAPSGIMQAVAYEAVLSEAVANSLK